MYHVKLADEMKKRNNIERIGTVAGLVIGVNPLKISILNGDVILGEDDLYVCQSATDYTMDVITTEETGTAYHQGLQVNDKVAMVAAENNQKFFVIDKIVG